VLFRSSVMSAHYAVYAPDDTVTAISIFNDYAGAEESNRRVLAWTRTRSTVSLARGTSVLIVVRSEAHCFARSSFDINARHRARIANGGACQLKLRKSL